MIMNPSPTIEQVDAAVKAVLGTLQRSPVADSAVRMFAGRLLAERHVETFDPALTTIGLAPGTVITPLARDLLKRRGVAIRWVHQDRAGRANAGTWGFAIDSESGLASSLRRLLLTGSPRWDEIDESEAAYWVAQAPDRGVAVLTAHPALTVWRAHRLPGVRAASAADPESLSNAIADLGVNLLAIDLAGQTVFSIKHLLAVFCRQGAPALPIGWTSETRHEDRRGDRSSDLFSNSSPNAARAFAHHSADAFGRLAGGFNGPGR